jgi:hypothetical protein
LFKIIIEFNIIFAAIIYISLAHNPSISLLLGRCALRLALAESQTRDALSVAGQGLSDVGFVDFPNPDLHIRGHRDAIDRVTGEFAVPDPSAMSC